MRERAWGDAQTAVPVLACACVPSLVSFSLCVGAVRGRVWVTVGVRQDAERARAHAMVCMHKQWRQERFGARGPRRTGWLRGTEGAQGLQHLGDHVGIVVLRRRPLPLQLPTRPGHPSALRRPDARVPAPFQPAQPQL
jgi:hypothetical protein